MERLSKEMKGYTSSRLTFHHMCLQAETGIDFDSNAAQALLVDVERRMDVLASEVEPTLPSRSLKKGEEKDYTFPAKPFKADGTLSVHGARFLERHGLVLIGTNHIQWGTDAKLVKIEGGKLLDATVPMTLANQEDIKDYLQSEGWVPTLWNYKKDSTGKPERTSGGSLIKMSPKMQEQGRLCENLEEMDAPLAKRIVEWLSLSNRKGILRGWLRDPRLEIDGRLSAGAAGIASSHRQRHCKVVNLPKADPSVILGKEMRSLFVARPGQVLVGYDASALEARVEAHWCYPYEGGVEYAKTLIEKDVHMETTQVVFAQHVGHLVGTSDWHKDNPEVKPWRSKAKNIRYACLPLDNTDVLTADGFKPLSEIKVGDKVFSVDKNKHCLVPDVVLATHAYEDADIVRTSSSHFSVESTADHRWYGWQHRGAGHRKDRRVSWEFQTTDNYTTDFNILNAVPYVGGNSDVTPSEASLVAWLLSDGHYKWSTKSERTSASNGKKKGVRASIDQSINKFTGSVRRCLNDNTISFVENVREMENGNHVIKFTLRAKHAREFLDRVVPGRENKHDFNWSAWILDLSTDSLMAFIRAFWKADGGSMHGWKDPLTFKQNQGNVLDGLVLACHLMGWKVTSSGGKCKFINCAMRGYTTCQRLNNAFSRKTSVGCLTTNNGTFVMRQNGFTTITGNCGYGAQAKKIASMLGVSVQEASDIIDLFWEGAKPLSIFKAKLEMFWETTGEKQWVVTIDGRRIPARSKHSLVNSVFQSTGAILMDTSALFMAKWLGGVTRDNMGYPCYRYKDTWVYRVAYMHDELVWSCDPSVAEEIGIMGVRSIVKAGEFLKLRVPLDASAEQGRSWADIH